jgi:ketosteroid isomerase-like protein
MDVEEVTDRFKEAANEFAKGNPEPVKALYSHRDDVIIANPFGPAVRGWERVSAALDFASSRFRDGSVTDFERIAEYMTDDLVTIHETERWQAKVGDRPEVEAFVLRVTTTFRREDGTWKVVHRHADPIATQDESGPVRGVPA